MLFRKTGDNDGSAVKGTFTTKAASSVGHGGHAIALIDNKIYAYGGSNAALNTVMEVYNIATKVWAALPDGTLTTYLGCTVTTPDGVWAHGGGTDSAVFNNLTKIS